MSVKIIIARNVVEKKLAYQLRFKMMCENLGWLPAREYPTKEEQDEYDPGQSIIFLATDFMGNCVGTSRLILEGMLSFPIEKYFRVYPREFIEAVHGKLRHCVEVSRFIVPESRHIKNHEITLMLCRSMIKRSIRMGVTHAFLSADHRFFRLLKMMGFQIVGIGEPKFYMGSKTVPGILPLENLLTEIKYKKPSLYEYLTEDEEIPERMGIV